MKHLAVFLLLSFIGFYPIELIAQKELSEPDKLKFEAAFFEALKQKAIGNYDKAIDALEICQSIDSTNIGVQFELSKNYFGLKNYFGASQTLNKALKKEPRNIWLLEHAKNIAVAQNDYLNAIAYQNKIIAIKPTKRIGLINLYLAVNDTVKAIELLNTLEKEQGLDTQFIILKKSLLKSSPKKKQGKISNNLSLEVLRSKYNSTKDFKLLITLLNLEAKQKDYNNLSADATKGLELYPSQAIVYLFAAQANNALKNYSAALAHLDNGIDFVIDKLTQKNYYLAYSISYNGLKNIQKANYYKKLAAQL